MRAAKMKDRPDFPLMRQTDVQHIYHMQMPRWLFSDPRYAEMSLDAKVTYTFLLNRFQLSRRNGWVNEHGEVFIIFPRKELVRELRICQQRVTAAFHVLVDLKLIWEQRCGLGDANQIYLANVEPQDDPGYTSAPFIPEDGQCYSRTTDIDTLGDDNSSSDAPEMQDLPHQSNETCDSRTTDIDTLEYQKPTSSYIEKKKTETSDIEVSQSKAPTGAGRQTDDEEELMGILDACELSSFDPDTARAFEGAIERLFYSDSFRVGNATLPQSRVRARLRQLDCLILQDAERKLHANLSENVKNSTAYIMSTILNAVIESSGDLVVDGYLNSLRAAPEGG